MMWLLLTVALAGAEDDLTSELARGVSVNWTRGVVQVEAGSYRAGAQAAKAVEQSARLAIDDRLADELGEVPVTGALSVDDLLQSADFGPPLVSRRSRWRVVEAVYAASGKVDLQAELSLQDFLKPYTLSLAVPTPPTAQEGPHTGLIVDARGEGLAPVYVPTVSGPDGAPIWSGEMYDEDAVTTAPCVWVAHPDHPVVAERVGASPLRVKGVADGAGRVRVGAADAAALRSLKGTMALGHGRVVMVTDL